MTAHPIDLVVVDNVKVVKTDFRTFIRGRTSLVLNSSGEINSLVLVNTISVTFNGNVFAYDSTDTTTSHDGVTVLVDGTTPNGRRYKRTDLNMLFGGSISFANGDVLINHSANALNFLGASNGYNFDAPVVIVGSASQFNALYAQSTNGDNIAGPTIILDRNTPTPAANDDLGDIIFFGRDNLLNVQNYGTIRVRSDNVTNGSESGRMIFSLAFNGTLTDYIGIVPGIVFPANGNDTLALGTATLGFSDLFFASGAVTGYNNGNVTVTHAAGALAFNGATGVSISMTYSGADGTQPLIIDAGASALDGTAGFSVRMPNTGAQKAFQLTSTGAIASWASFEFSVGGAGKPGFALGPGSAVRDVFLYRDSTSVLRTNSALVVDGTFFIGGVQTYSNIPQNSQSAAYTLVLADAQKHILHPTADNNARTFTIPANASVAYPIGTAITFVNQINTVTIAITTDTMTLAGPGTSGSRTLAANGIATALKTTATAWIISGTGLT
jgi:hypothetical protein